MAYPDLAKWFIQKGFPDYFKKNVDDLEGTAKALRDAKDTKHKIKDKAITASGFQAELIPLVDSTYKKEKIAEIEKAEESMNVSINDDFPSAGGLKALQQEYSFSKKSDEIDAAFDSKDINSLKTIPVKTSRQKEYQDNLRYNLSGTLYREARDKGDISRLRELKNIVDKDWISDIDKAISDIEEKQRKLEAKQKG